jgi:molecular chaperone IbpA
MTTTLALRSLLDDLTSDKFYQNAIGFDRLFDDLSSAARSVSSQTTYPPHNLRQVADDAYIIEFAVAGFRPEDLDVSVEKQVLTVTGTRPDASDTQKYLHRGLAFRSFTKQIPLAEHIEVRDAQLEHGVLSVSVVRVLPEKERKRRIPIGQSTAAITA